MDFKKFKKYLVYGLYLLPFVGFAIEKSKPKEKRTKFGTILSALGIAGPLSKVVVSYFIYGTSTGNWPPFDINNSIKENNKLEQKIECEKADIFHSPNLNKKNLNKIDSVFFKYKKYQNKHYENSQKDL